MRSPVVARLWPVRPSVREARRGGPSPSTDVNVEEVYAAFKAGIEKQIGIDAAQTHLDLAQAYGEMGLMVDAIRAAATALRAGAPLTVASRALNWMLSPERAHPDALPTIARMSQGE